MKNFAKTLLFIFIFGLLALVLWGGIVRHGRAQSLPPIATVAPASATYSPQPNDGSLPGVTTWGVNICSSTNQASTISGGRFYDFTVGHFDYVATAQIQSIGASHSKTSIAHKVALGAELTGGGVTVAQSLNWPSIKDSWKAAAPSVAALAAALDHFVVKEHPDWSMPANVLPAWVSVPPKGCSDYVIFGRTNSAESTFHVEFTP